MPFYWWCGERLTRERLRWQLDRLASQPIAGVIISYSHLPDGSVDPGDPPVFSEAWWDLFLWFVQECRQRGLQVGWQDYNLLTPLLTEIAASLPEMQGSGTLSSVCQMATGPATITLPTAGQLERPVVVSDSPHFTLM